MTETRHAHAATVADLRPTTLIVFGNPALGTPLMQRRPTVGIDLPQKLPVHEDADGDVFVTWNDPYSVARRHRAPDERQTLRIDTALRNPAALAAAGG